MKKTDKYLLIVLMLLMCLALSFFIRSLRLSRIGSRVVQHKVIYHRLNEFHKNNDYWSSSIEELVKDWKKKDYILTQIKYYPQNWPDSNAVVLESEIYGKKIITYANGEIKNLGDE